MLGSGLKPGSSGLRNDVTVRFCRNCGLPLGAPRDPVLGTTTKRADLPSDRGTRRSELSKLGDLLGLSQREIRQRVRATPQYAGYPVVLKQGLDRVNQTQASAADIATKFEKGVPGVELSQVMLESQKASVAFRATVEVRNRLVSAYQEIMNMPI